MKFLHSQILHHAPEGLRLPSTLYLDRITIKNGLECLSSKAYLPLSQTNIPYAEACVSSLTISNNISHYPDHLSP